MESAESAKVVMVSESEVVLFIMSHTLSGAGVGAVAI